MNKFLKAFIDMFKVPDSVVKDAISSSNTRSKRKKDIKPLGHVSKHFESGRSGPGTISSGRGDPGGKSYGCHQLASNTGTLQAYLKRSIYAPEFKGLKATSKPFDKKWREIAKRDPGRFADDQLAFIKKTHFDGVRGYANGLNIPSTQAVDEALFSISVQHGKAKRIVKNAGIDVHDSEKTMINKLYDSRVAYVRRIKLPAATKRSVLNRYVSERRMVLKLVK
jgi:hypothetical protein